MPVKVALLELDATEKEAENIQLDLSRLNAEAIWNCAQLERLTSTQFALWLCPTALMPKNEDFEQEIVLTVRIGISGWKYFLRILIFIILELLTN